MLIVTALTNQEVTFVVWKIITRGSVGGAILADNRGLAAASSNMTEGMVVLHGLLATQRLSLTHIIMESNKFLAK